MNDTLQLTTRSGTSGGKPRAGPIARAIGQTLAAEVPADWQQLEPSLWLDCWSAIDGQARMLLTRERVFLRGDSKARMALQSSDGFRLRRMRIETTAPTEQKNFERLLQVPPGETRTLCIRNGDHDGHVLLRAALLAELSNIPIIAVAFHKADRHYALQWANLAEIFNLTPAEHRIVSLLLNGLGADAIVDELHLSINTVRTHIKHVYEKLQISCREELWRLLAPYRLA